MGIRMSMEYLFGEEQWFSEDLVNPFKEDFIEEDITILCDICKEREASYYCPVKDKYYCIECLSVCRECEICTAKELIGTIRQERTNSLWKSINPYSVEE